MPFVDVSVFRGKNTTDLRHMSNHVRSFVMLDNPKPWRRKNMIKAVFNLDKIGFNDIIDVF